MIGWYVHHHGHGHLHRARSVAEALAARGLPVTGLSSLPRPDGWPGDSSDDWIQLARDDSGAADPADATAGGRLHWVPRGDAGLRARSAALSAWIERAAPELVVSDVSVEVALLARLHGVPVVSVVLPGDRRDPAHRLGYDVSSALVAVWPPRAQEMVRGPDPERIRCVGALARYPVAPADALRAAGGSGPRRVVVLHGSGGEGPSRAVLTAAREQTPGWEWTVLGGDGGWVADPWPVICGADVVVTHAGQNALAEVAAARRPAVVVPQDRPHLEQRTTAAALVRGGWPVLVEETFPDTGWAERLEAAVDLDGSGWATWCDGHAAERFAELIAEQVAGVREPVAAGPR